MNPFTKLKMQAIVWIWNHTPNCAEMSRLSSRSLDQPLTLSTRLRMRLHFLICVWCERYAGQLRFLQQAGRQVDQQVKTLPSLSIDARKRILKNLKMVAGNNL